MLAQLEVASLQAQAEPNCFIVGCILSLRSTVSYCLLWLLLPLSLCPSAAATDGRLQDYFRESWTTRDGLPHNTINSIMQTDDGYLWFATWEGVARYNGRDFQVFGRGELTQLPDDGVFTLANDCQGNLLVAGARGGISFTSKGRWSGLPSAPVLVRALLCDSQARLWIGTDGSGVMRDDRHGKRQVFNMLNGLQDESVFDLLEDPLGRIWVATAQGLFVIEDDKVSPVTEFRGLPSGPVFSLAWHPSDGLLAGTEQGAFRLHGQQFQLLDNELANLPISKLLVDDTALWLGTIGRGLYRLGPYGLEHLGQEDGLPNGRITAIYKDKEQSVWLGTNGGLFRLRDAAFRTFTTEQGLSDDFVRTLLTDEAERVWVGTSKGVNLLEKGQITHLPGQRIKQTILSLAHAREGGIWVGTFTHGLIHWRDNQEVTCYDRDTGLLSNEIRAILPAADGSLWLATSLGVNRIDQGRISALQVQDGLPSNFSVSLFESTRSGIWIGTSSGVARWQDGRLRALSISHLDGAQFVFGFFEQTDGQALWLATDRGLIRYRYEDEQLALLGRDKGMPFDKYFQVREDQQGNFWLSSNRGVLRISANQANRLLDGEGGQVEFSLFSESHGMVSAQANGGSNPAMALAENGRIWVATSKGVAVVQPARLQQFGDVRLPVVIEQMLVDGQALHPAANLTLSAGASRIEFQFAGLGYVVPARILYRTRLQGFDKGWVYRGTHNNSEYTSLPPGEYRFEVMASYPSGDWGGEVAQLRFKIPPRFWQHPGFAVGVGLLFVMFLVLLIKLRLLALQRSAKRLEEQVQEQTQALRWQTESLKRADEEKSQLLEQIRLQAEAYELQARQDALTGLANRRAFDEALHREFSRAVRQANPFCLLLLDLDHFKRINDNWSHAVGDVVLQRVAECLRLLSRDADLVARWGGEEFAVLLPNTDLHAAHKLAERLRLAIQALDYSALAPELSVTASIGLAEQQDCQDSEQMLQRADTALYQAKQNGRNQTCIAG